MKIKVYIRANPIKNEIFNIMSDIPIPKNICGVDDKYILDFSPSISQISFRKNIFPWFVTFRISKRKLIQIIKFNSKPHKVYIHHVK